MSNFSLTDILDELDKLAPEDTSLDAATGRSSADKYLTTIKGNIARLLVADPDAIYGLMYITKQTIESLCTSLITDLTEIETLLPSALADDSRTDLDLLDEIKIRAADVKIGSLTARQEKLKGLYTKVKNLIRTVERTQGFIGTTVDAHEAQHKLGIAMKRIRPQLAALVDLHKNFLLAIDRYYDSKLLIPGVDSQIDTLLTRLEDFDGGRNIARASLALSIGIGLLDERLVVRVPSTPKYKGKLTIEDGTAAFSTGYISFPQNVIADDLLYVTVDSDVTPSTHLKIPASTKASVSVPLRTYAPDVVDPEKAILDIFPYTNTNGCKLIIVVDNTKYEVPVEGDATPIIDFDDLATKMTLALNSLTVPVTVSNNNGTFTFTATGKFGGLSRISFANTANPGADQGDINVDFGITFDAVGEVRGVGTTFDDISLVNFNPITPILTVSNEVLLRIDNVVWGSIIGDTLITYPAINTIALPGDTVESRGTFYRVDSVAGNDLKLTTAKVADWDGTTLEDVTAPTEVSSAIIRRNVVTITSPSKVWGTTKLEFPNYISSNSLGVSENASTYGGIHNKATLVDSTSIGSPPRIGDVLVTNDTQELPISKILGFRNKSLYLSLIAPENVDGTSDTLQNDDILILSLGAWSYRQAHPILLLHTEELYNTPNIDLLEAKLGIALASGMGAADVKNITNKYITLLTSVRTTYEGYLANTPNAVIDLLRRLGENQLQPLCRKLKALDFDGLYSLTPQDLSLAETIISQVGSISESMGTTGEFMQVYPEPNNIWHQDIEPENETYPIVQTGQES